jgi:hypothetical protein
MAWPEAGTGFQGRKRHAPCGASKKGKKLLTIPRKPIIKSLLNRRALVGFRKKPDNVRSFFMCCLDFVRN